MKSKEEMYFSSRYLTCITLCLLYHQVALKSHSALACVVPIGLDDGTGINIADLAVPVLGSFPGIYGSAVTPGIPYLTKYETPVLMRINHIYLTGAYNAAAAFEPTALEFLGRHDISEARRRCLSASNFSDHRAVSLAYSILWHLIEFLPEGEAEFKAVAASWNLDLDICNKLSTCNDIRTPWGLAKSILADAKAIFSNDGWNADGSLSSTYNKIPYKDWRTTPYKPKKCKMCSWQPLEETNYHGFLFRQEHVTPHIGETGRSIYLGDDYICAKKSPTPNYNYNYEITNTLNRTANLDDFQKMEVEYFDAKVQSLGYLAFDYYAPQGVSADDFIFLMTDLMLHGIIYESVLLSWREKVRWDKIRPPTLVHEMLGDQPVYSYLGNAYKSAGILPANEWQPYIRIMPHSEYPSGTSCMCTAYAQGFITLTGSDDVTAKMGRPLMGFIPAGSSRFEKGTPINNITFTYSKWTDMAKACGVSRINGGIHFTESIPAGEALCKDIGTKIAEYYQKLVAGMKPDFVLDPVVAMTSPPPQKRNCGS